MAQYCDATSLRTMINCNEPSRKIVQGQSQTLNDRGIVKNCRHPRTACICNRSKTTILCRNCGHLMYGRVRMTCLAHEKITFLCEITNCDACKSFACMLEELPGVTYEEATMEEPI